MDQQARQIFKLIENATNLDTVRNFLKSKNVPSSGGSWDFMTERRIGPAFDEGLITIGDLIELLRNAEEHARQHIFLFATKPERAAEMMSSQRVNAVAKANKLAHVLAAPDALEMPDAPTIVDIRHRNIATVDGIVKTLIIKEIETRESFTFLGISKNNGRLIKEYATEKSRAVNIARLYSNGLLELRIAARDNTNKYQDDVRRFFKAVGKFFLEPDFQPVSLRKAKNKLWSDRGQLQKLIRYSQFRAKNESGVSMTATTGALADNLAADAGAQKGMQEFMNLRGYGHSSNIFFKIPDSDPPREVHVLISGESNEFALTTACTSEDYEYVLRQILALNQ